MIIKIIPNDKGNPPGKLGDAEIHFSDGELEGLKLIGFAIWERRTGPVSVEYGHTAGVALTVRRCILVLQRPDLAHQLTTHQGTGRRWLSVPSGVFLASYPPPLTRYKVNGSRRIGLPVGRRPGE